MDLNLKYFIAISENKRKELELKGRELQIDDLKKKMLTKYWKDKTSIFDDMIRLNVKTPSYDYERIPGANHDEDKIVTLGPMNIDSKLMSNKPVVLQRGLKAGERIEPVINIEGTDAVCYPNKEAKKGRKVELNRSILRRIEQCKALEQSIASIRCKSAFRRETLQLMHSNAPAAPRPNTAPGLSDTSSPNDSRPLTSPGLVSNESVDVNRISSTSVGPLKRGAYISTSAPMRSSTSSLLGSLKPGAYISTPSSGRPSTSLSSNNRNSAS